VDATLQPDGTLKLGAVRYRLSPYRPLRGARRAWLVCNLHSGAVYAVEQLHGGRWRCSCPASRFNPARTCKHRTAVGALVAAAEAAGLVGPVHARQPA
jgi:hypothetical protein